MDSTSALNAVNVAIDGIPFGAAGIGNRQDACDGIGNWPGCPNVGWSYWLDTADLSDGPHELAVTAILANGRQTTSMQTFVVQNQASADYEALVTDNSGNPVNCLPSDVNLTSRAITRSPGTGGLIHVTYSIDNTSDPSVYQPIKDAILAWNNVSAQTGVVFDPPAPGKHVDLPFIFQSDADTKQACAYEDPNRSVIAYGNTWKSSDSQAPAIIHEIGHYLGLNDIANNNPSVPTIMNQPTNGWPNGCLSPNMTSKSIQSIDPTEIRICRSVAKTYASLINSRQRRIDAAKKPNQFTVTAPYDSPDGGGTTCTYIYETVDFYVDGVYDSSEDFIVEVICN